MGLNLEVIKKLYEFGGLLVHRVIYFDPIAFNVAVSLETFNETKAKEQAKMLESNGFVSSICSYLVKFDGAFAE